MDVTTIAILQKYVNNALVDNGNVTPEEREKLSRIIIDSTGDMFLADDGTYKTVPTGTTNYDDLDGKPSINSVELDGNKTASQLGFSSVATTGSYNDLSDTPTEITMLSQLINDTGFITNTVGNLLNYYLKTETYNKTEVNNLISNLSSIDVKIVETLPTTGISTSTIYLIKIGSTTNYEQWMYIDSAWANIGSTVIDLSNYYNKTETDALLNNKVDKVTGLGLSQNSYTTAEKTKLAGLNNYTLPTATPSILGGIKPDNSTTFVDSNGILSAVGGASGVIDDNVTSLSKTWSSSKISESINAVGEIANDISIAQKTVNTRGTKELLSQEYSYNLTPSTTMGTGNLTAINQTITLKESIFNYDMINIQLKVNTNTVKVSYPIYTFKTSSVVFNNSEVLNFANGSAMNINKIQGTTSAGAWGSFSASFSFWFKDATHLFILNASTPSTAVDWANVVLSSVQGVNIENVTIDPVNYVNTTQGIEDTPVGHILSQMGKVAPKHYLICDGATYNITDYPYLSQYIKDQFGTFNFFGGNGTTTFAVPDLRNEFLRGYHGTKTEQLSGEVGVHQNATRHLGFTSYGSTASVLQSISTGANITDTQSEVDSSISGTNWRHYTQKATGTGSGINTFTSRPTNTAVLFCIKYEPTYFMSIQGMIEETTLWEGNIGNSTSTQYAGNTVLNDSLLDYDEIRFHLICWNGVNDPRIYSKTITPYDFNQMKSASFTTTSITFVWGYGSSTDYAGISKTSTDLNLNWLMSKSSLTKIIGIKYKTFQN